LIETVAQFGFELGCLVCPPTQSLRLYGGWQALLHEIGHFAIAPAFLRDIPSHAEAASAGRRPPVPAVDAFAVGIDQNGMVCPRGQVLWQEGALTPFVAAIAENPNPLTDWHVRAWTAWASSHLGLPTPRCLWLDSSPWADLCLAAELDHPMLYRPPGWGDRHPEKLDQWKERAAAPHRPDKELEWRLEDLGLIPG
jgi:hypothetical protein